VVDGVFASAGLGKAEALHPELLDLIDRQPVARVDVQVESHIVAGQAEARSKEQHECLDHRRIAVGKGGLVPVFCTLSPVEHAADDVQRLAAPCTISSLPLISASSLPMSLPPGGSSDRSGTGEVRSALLRGQLDVSCPDADR
jgi:hypothetical protein